MDIADNLHSTIPFNSFPWVPGSLAQTNVLGNMLFGTLSGSAVAAAAAIGGGGALTPMEEEEGYDPAFAACVNIASAPTGLLISPTSAFIVYSTVAGGVSISALFMAGYMPGILMGAVTMLIAYLYAKKLNYPVAEKMTLPEVMKVTMDAIPSMLLIVIVIGGIVGQYLLQLKEPELLCYTVWCSPYFIRVSVSES